MTADLLQIAWDSRTHSSYKAAFLRWKEYQAKSNASPTKPALFEVINFISHLVEQGLGYNSVLKYRVALANHIQVKKVKNWVKHPLIKRLFRGVYKLRPPLPNYMAFWHVSQLLKSPKNPTGR